jgi:uncharacterized Zn-finger protein
MKSKSLHDTPTAEDQQLDLERQYANLQDGEVTSIFCPWCGAGNVEGTPPCCSAFAIGIELIGKRQLESVFRQFNEVREGEIHRCKNRKKYVDCPYCQTRLKMNQSATTPDGWIRPNVSPFCCDLMGEAAKAFVEALTFETLKMQKAAIDDRRN